MDRDYISKYVLDRIIPNCGVKREDLEILVLDNGSKEKKVIEYGKSIADTHIQEEQNIGVAKGYNKLLRLAQGDFICLPNTDILMSNNWLSDLIRWNKKIENSGVVGIHCEGEEGYPLHVDGELIYKRNNNTVDGVCLFKKKLLDSIGGFDETYGRYGMEDADFAVRAFLSGHINYYIPKQRGVHLGNDFNSDTEYRRQKNADVKIATKVFNEKIEGYKKNNNLKVPLWK
jgi:GT2 family glycosyltransferase